MISKKNKHGFRYLTYSSKTKLWAVNFRGKGFRIVKHFKSKQKAIIFSNHVANYKKISRPKSSLDEKAIAVEMINNGFSLAELGIIIGRSIQTLSNWYSQYLGPISKSNTIITLKSKIDHPNYE